MRIIKMIIAFIDKEIQRDKESRYITKKYEANNKAEYHNNRNNESGFAFNIIVAMR